jgi:hypothetical protein
MEAKCFSRLANIGALVGLGCLVTLDGLSHVATTGARDITFSEPGPFSFRNVSFASVAGSLASLCTLLIPAILLTLFFVFSSRSRSRALAIAGSILLPFGWCGVFLSRSSAPFSFFLFLPFLPVDFVAALVAMASGASHTGEWWSEHVEMSFFFGAMALWLIAWAGVGAMECIAWFRRWIGPEHRATIEPDESSKDGGQVSSPAAAE